MWVINHVVKNNFKKPIIFDVGANKGFYSLALQRILNNNADIYCFEPSEYTYKELQKNTKNIPNIKTFNFGFSDKCEQLILHSSSENGLSSIYGNNPLTTFKNKETISLNTLDNFCHSNKEIDFLKIDVEGHEYKVLLGAFELLKSDKIKIIQFEIGECTVKSN